MIICPSPNFNLRPDHRVPDMIVLHYTGMQSAKAALERMCDPEAEVSAHYMIDEDGTVYRLVAEEMRAWHAGRSSWEGVTDINGLSIGIELVNPGHPLPGYEGGYRPFPQPQMTSLLSLLREIDGRYSIRPDRILGHSDVAPDRKQDPGELFDWEWLASEGFGLVPMPHSTSGEVSISEFQTDLRRIGYGIEVTGVCDQQTMAVVTAFQRHYRRSSVTGDLDPETFGAAKDLLRQKDLIGG